MKLKQVWYLVKTWICVRGLKEEFFLSPELDLDPPTKVATGRALDIFGYHQTDNTPQWRTLWWTSRWALTVTWKDGITCRLGREVKPLGQVFC